MKRIAILTILAFMAMGCGGCSLQINSIVSVPHHLKLTWTGVTLSWPVILAVVVGLWLYTTVKRWIRDAGQKGGE